MKITTILWATICLMLAQNLHSQTVVTTIDYSYAPLNDSCNVFSYPTNHQGFMHQTTFGYPSFTDDAIAMASAPRNSSSAYGTGYRIPFNFKSGYTYHISVNGKSIATTGPYTPNIALSITNSTGGTNHSQQCSNGPAQISLSDIATYAQGPFSSSYAWISNLISTTLAQNYSYLLVAGFPFSLTNSGNGTTYIRKIQIVEVPPPCTQTPAPAGLSSTVTNNSASLSFNQSISAESYTVDYKASTSSTWINIPNPIFNPLNNSYPVYGLSNGTTYDWRVRANCSAGSGSYAQSQFTTSNCDVPLNVTSSNITTNSATVSWSAVSGATSYNISCEKSITHEVILQNVNTTSTSYNITGLQSSSLYNVTVNTICASGVSNFAPGSFLTSGTCPDVSNLATSSVTCNRAVLSWTHPSSPAFGFAYIDYKTAASSTWIAAPGFLLTTPYTLTGLTSGTAYDWRVRSQCLGQAGTYFQSQFTTAPGSCRMANIVSTPKPGVTIVGTGRKEATASPSIYLAKRSDIAATAQVFPSPAHNEITIQLDGKWQSKVGVRLVNAYGSAVYVSDINIDKKKLFSIDISRVANGFYILSLSDGLSVTVKKIIVQH